MGHAQKLRKKGKFNQKKGTYRRETGFNRNSRESWGLLLDLEMRINTEFYQ